MQRHLDECCEQLAKDPARLLPDMHDRLGGMLNCLQRMADLLPSLGSGEDADSPGACVDVLVDCCPYPVAVTDGRGIVERVNPAAASLLNGTPRDLNGMSLSTFFTAPDTDVAPRLAGAMTDRNGCSATMVAVDGTKIRAAIYAFSLPTRNGREQIRWTFFPDRPTQRDDNANRPRPQLVDAVRSELAELDPHGDMEHSTNEELQRRLKARTIEFFNSMDMMRQEIAERKQAEKQLEHERDFISAVMETVGALVVVTDYQGRVARFNRASERLTGRTAEEVHGKCLWDLFMTPREGQAMRRAFEALKSEDKPQQLETRWTVSRGQRRMIYWTLTELKRGEGYSSYIIASGIDVTEQRAMAVELQHAEKMAALGRVASGIAHEVGNPLASVSARLQRMKNRKDADFLDQSIPLLLDQIQRMTRIIRAVSTFSRPQSLEWGACEISQILDETVRVLALDPRAATIDIACDIPYALPPIFGSQDQLQQAFLNIGLNALDAMPDGGRLHIKAFATLDEICLNFSDTGSGMPLEVQEKVFDPFFTTKISGLGTGLGLALTYNYIESHGGRITVDSTENKGTVFHVFIPRREPPEKPPDEHDE